MSGNVLEREDFSKLKSHKKKKKKNFANSRTAWLRLLAVKIVLEI